ETVGQVIESKSDAFKPGDLVHCFGGWASHSRLDAKAARKVNTHGLPLSLALGVLGMPGLTAYAGIVRLAAVKPGDVFVVSAASGPVGSAAAQLARLRGAKTIGIVGSQEKADWITGPAQFDGAINYRSETVAEGLKRTCPDGVDIYFDAIGGDVLEAVCEVLRLEARVVLYGLVAQYNSADRLLGPPPGLIIRARAHMHGLVVYDHEDLRADMEAEIAAAIKAGDFAVNEEVHEGLAAAPEAFHRLMSGQNFGKSIVKIFK
ncbi:MAG: NADP-dependent oxidoreductase, partial [Pseudomonadota bacterium]